MATNSQMQSDPTVYPGSFSLKYGFTISKANPAHKEKISSVKTIRKITSLDLILLLRSLRWP